MLSRGQVSEPPALKDPFIRAPHHNMTQRAAADSVAGATALLRDPAPGKLLARPPLFTPSDPCASKERIDMSHMIARQPISRVFPDFTRPGPWASYESRSCITRPCYGYKKKIQPASKKPATRLRFSFLSHASMSMNGEREDAGWRKGGCWNFAPCQAKTNDEEVEVGSCSSINLSHLILLSCTITCLNFLGSSIPSLRLLAISFSPPPSCESLD